jgi:hypothetical protein
MKNAVSGMWRHVALVKTDVSEERIAFIIRVKESELGTLAVTSNGVTSQKTAFIKWFLFGLFFEPQNRAKYSPESLL